MRQKECKKIERQTSDDAEVQRRHAIVGIYEDLKNNPRLWQSAALKFKRVADLARAEVDNDEDDQRPASEKLMRIDDTYVFLMSVAIENILKGILMASGKGCAKSYEKITTHHNLVTLYNDYCKRYGLRATEDDCRLLSILTHAAKWAGRFNLPRRSEDLVDVVEQHGLFMGYGLSISPLLSKGGQAEPGELRTEREKITALYERLYAHFLTVSKLNGLKDAK
jgi:hypothetical protein